MPAVPPEVVVDDFIDEPGRTTLTPCPPAQLGLFRAIEVRTERQCLDETVS
jgi:hypothetical protein